MVSIKDVAKEADVSTATVSRVINRSSKVSDEVVGKVRAAIKKLNYHPVIGRQSLSTIGAVVSDVAEPFFGQMLKGIEHVARAQGKQLVIHNADYDAHSEWQAIERLIGYCDCAVIHSKWLSDDELYQLCAQIPNAVLINRTIEQMPGRCVVLNNEHGSYLATQYLLNKGHRDILYLQSEQPIEDGVERLRGFQRAMSEAGLSVTTQHIIHCEPTTEGGAEGMHRALAANIAHTAVMTYNDVMAAGVVDLLIHNQYRVPQDVAVVGFDDLVIAKYSRPALSTVRYPIELMAQQATRIALGMEAPSDNALFMPTLVVRDSA